jgi:N utilization substance protein A
MVDDASRSMDVIVPDDQLSLAIGKKGQNVRLAVQLTRFRIDIKSESYMRQVQREMAEALAVVAGAGEYEAKLLLDHGVASLQELAEADDALLTAIPGISETGAAQVRERAAQLAAEKAQREAEEARQQAEAGQAAEGESRGSATGA